LVRASFWGAIIAVIGLLLFERRYLRDKSWNKFLYFAMIFAIGLFFVFTPFIVREAVIVGDSYRFNYGPLYPLFGLSFIGIFLNSYIRIVYRYITSKRRLERLQLRFFVLGISLSFLVGIITNLIYPVVFGNSSLSRFGPLGMVFCAIFITYAIFKHHLFDIKMILSEILLGLMGIILFVYIFTSNSLYQVVVNIVFFVIFAFVAVTLLRELLKGIHREHQLERANGKLKATIESKDLFLRMTSHQLRTPLTSLNGFLSLVLERGQTRYKMNDATYDDLVKVYLNSQHLISIVNDILTVNAIKADRFGVIMRPSVNIKDEIQYLIEDNRHLLKHYQTTVSLKTIGEDFNSSMDSVRMKNVFYNLLTNAVYYGNGKVWITITDEDDRFEIRVRDNGLGVSVENKDKIFTERFRVKGEIDKNPNGSGLGLFISKTIVKLHHGTLKLKNPGSGQGAVFVIKIPKRAEQDKYEG
jgi:signal transduction histidine kinase